MARRTKAGRKTWAKETAAERLARLRLPLLVCVGAGLLGVAGEGIRMVLAQSAPAAKGVPAWWLPAAASYLLFPFSLGGALWLAIRVSDVWDVLSRVRLWLLVIAVLPALAHTVMIVWYLLQFAGTGPKQ